MLFLHFLEGTIDNFLVERGFSSTPSRFICNNVAMYMHLQNTLFELFWKYYCKCFELCTYNKTVETKEFYSCNIVFPNAWNYVSSSYFFFMFFFRRVKWKAQRKYRVNFILIHYTILVNICDSFDSSAIFFYKLFQSGYIVLKKKKHFLFKILYIECIIFFKLHGGLKKCLIQFSSILTQAYYMSARIELVLTKKKTSNETTILSQADRKYVIMDEVKLTVYVFEYCLCTAKTQKYRMGNG